MTLYGQEVMVIEFRRVLSGLEIDWWSGERRAVRNIPKSREGDEKSRGCPVVRRVTSGQESTELPRGCRAFRTSPSGREGIGMRSKEGD